VSGCFGGPDGKDLKQYYSSCLEYRLIKGFAKILGKGFRIGAPRSPEVIISFLYPRGINSAPFESGYIGKSLEEQIRQAQKPRGEIILGGQIVPWSTLAK